MKKLSLILAGVVLFGGMSFARPIVRQDKPKTEKKVAVKEKKTAVKEKKVATKEKKVAAKEKKAAK